jgi:hypothetical protein
MHRNELFGQTKLIIGVVHLKPLPGSMNFKNLDEVVKQALTDAKNLVEGGVEGLIIENFGDAPFYPNRVPPHTIASLVKVVQEVRREFKVPMGVNVLRNDAISGLAIAHVCQLQFIRVNIFIGASLTDQGLIEGEAHRIIRYREFLKAESKIFADVNVKHSQHLASKDIKLMAQEVAYRGLADALIITGEKTGQPPDVQEVLEVREAVPDRPILVGSGLDPGNIMSFYNHADGFIVGSYFKKGGKISNSVDPARVKTLCGLVKQMRSGFKQLL